MHAARAFLSKVVYYTLQRQCDPLVRSMYAKALSVFIDLQPIENVVKYVWSIQSVNPRRLCRMWGLWAGVD